MISYSPTLYEDYTVLRGNIEESILVDTHCVTQAIGLRRGGTGIRMAEVDRRYPDSEMVRLMQIGIQPIKSHLPRKHAYLVRNQKFVIHEKYRIHSVIGTGAYGMVVSAMDTDTSEKVAVKQVARLFDNLGDAKRILREIRLMRVLEHKKILNIKDMEVPDSPDDFNEIYIISPLFDNDLEHLLSSGVPLQDSHIQFFTHQLLCAVKYMHSARVLHRDLKPANVLVLENCDIVVCDLGLARYQEVTFADNTSPEMTEYVVTRWYRAPELVLSNSYTPAVDIWSLGCILGEFLGRQVMFPGRDFRHQVEIVISLIGKPALADCQHITSLAARKFLEDMPPAKPISFQKLFPEANPQAIDLLNKMLTFSPDKRITAQQALEHPYLAKYHNPINEPSVGHAIEYGNLEPKGEKGAELTANEIRALILQEISHFRRMDPLFVQRPEFLGE